MINIISLIFLALIKFYKGDRDMKWFLLIWITMGNDGGATIKEIGPFETERRCVSALKKIKSTDNSALYVNVNLICIQHIRNS